MGWGRVSGVMELVGRCELCIVMRLLGFSLYG